MNTGYIFLRQGVNTLKIAHLMIVLSVLVFKIALLKTYLGYEQMLHFLFLGKNSQLRTSLLLGFWGLPVHNYYISVRTYDCIYS